MRGRIANLKDLIQVLTKYILSVIMMPESDDKGVGTVEKQCECIVHRYHVFHITPEGDVFSHSQSSWDWAKLHGKTENIVTVSTREYRHDLTREQAKAIYIQLRSRHA